MKAKVLYQNVLVTFGILSTPTQSWGILLQVSEGSKLRLHCLVRHYIHCFDCLSTLRLFKSTG